MILKKKRQAGTGKPDLLIACLCATHGQCNTYSLLHDLGSQRANN